MDIRRAPQSTIVSRILQVALGLFVTTSDLPSLPANHESLTYDCSFDSACRWTSVGEHVDKWRVARGEPDSLLWLAATGTMQLPREPFTLIEMRGEPVDVLMTDAIRCQQGTASLGFTYWAIGSADLEICLTDENNVKFNCTGMLHSSAMPGKVALKVPQLQKPFKIMISPNNQPGILVIDDIRYDANICEPVPPPQPPLILPEPQPPRGMPSTPAPTVWTLPTIPTEPPTTPSTTTTTQAPTQPPTIATNAPLFPFALTTKSPLPFTRGPIPSTTTDVPFDLMVIGNRTTPLFDRRLGIIVKESEKLLCDFKEEFSCQWGAEAGRWAIVTQGAIPSLEQELMKAGQPLPTYPAALVLQGTAMLTSDPIRCQTGAGKVLFRYWTNGELSLQVCALGYGIDSTRIECVDANPRSRHDPSLAVFDLPHSIKESFTLNIVPQWEKTARNKFVLLDEIAYIGECTPGAGNGAPPVRPTKVTPVFPGPPPEVAPEVVEPIIDEMTPSPVTPMTPPTIVPVTPEFVKPSQKTVFTKKFPTVHPTTTLSPPSSTEEEEMEELGPDENSVTTTRRSYTVKTTTGAPVPRYFTTTVEPSIDYCQLLNCNFDDNACNYLNHGLTKVPWTLRNRGYGYPLTGQTDVRPTPTNGQFVSALMAPGDVAILESPKFNLTQSLNVLLFQYYRPTHLSTLRLCLGSSYSPPLRTAAAFAQCPTVLRSLTSRNAYRWNTLHVQLPPGTTHFYLVAQLSERAETRSAIALDNMRVAICDPRNYDPDTVQRMFEPSP